MEYPARFDAPVESVADIPPIAPSEELVCDWGNAEACAADNALRARWAGAAVKTYAELTGPDEPPKTVISDLLNDLRHLCDALGLDFEEVARPLHYEYELRGEF